MNMRTLPRDFVGVHFAKADAPALQEALQTARELIKRELSTTTNAKLMKANESLYSLEMAVGCFVPEPAA